MRNKDAKFAILGSSSLISSKDLSGIMVALSGFRFVRRIVSLILGHNEEGVTIFERKLGSPFYLETRVIMLGLAE